MTNIDGDARQVRKHPAGCGLLAQPGDRPQASEAAAVCPPASWTEEPTKRRAVNLNQTTHTFEPPRMQIGKAAPAQHRGLLST